MRIHTLLIVLLAAHAAHADIYKCVANGKTSFQQTPCKSTESGGEFKIPKDISLEQQKAAVEQLNADLAKLAEKKQRAREAANAERRVRAEENKVRAIYQNTLAIQEQNLQTERQTKVLEKQNRILRNNTPVFMGTQLQPKPLK